VTYSTLGAWHLRSTVATPSSTVHVVVTVFMRICSFVSLVRPEFVIDVTPRFIIYLITAPGLAVRNPLGIVLVITDLNTLT